MRATEFRPDEQFNSCDTSSSPIHFMGERWCKMDMDNGRKMPQRHFFPRVKWISCIYYAWTQEEEEEEVIINNNKNNDMYSHL